MKKLLVLVSLFMLAACDKTEDKKEDTVMAPSNLEIVDKTVSFDAVDLDDVFYNIYIDDVTTEKTLFLKIEKIKETSYTLTGLEDNKRYEISVEAGQGDVLSSKTNVVTIDTFVEAGQVKASHNTLENGPVTVLGIVSSEIYDITYNAKSATPLEDSTYQYEENVLSLDYSNLENDSTLTFYVFTDQGYYVLEVEKNSDKVPSIYGDTSFVFNNQDLYIQFNLAGGDLVELNGSDISSDDYTVIENTLIINKEFISTLFEANESRTSVILSYQLKTDDDIVIGYLFIEKE